MPQWHWNYKLVKISGISDNLHTNTELFKKDFWNKIQRTKSSCGSYLPRITQLLSFGLLLVILQMSSKIPFVGVIFRAQVTLETGTVNTTPLHVIEIGPTMNEFLATGFAFGITSLRGRNMRTLMFIKTSNWWELLGTFCTWKHSPDSMFAVVYLEAGCFGKVLVAWFAVVFLLPYMFHPDRILQGLRPHQSFVTNVACAVILGNIFKNRSRFAQLRNFTCVYSVHGQ